MNNSFTKSFSGRKLFTGTLLMFLMFFAQQSLAHTVTGYAAGCNSGPNYSIDANVINVNAASNYAWQYKNSAGSWVCIVNGNNTINGNTYSVSGATSTATLDPAPLVFNNPNSALQGLIVRCVISDGAGVNPCNTPAGNTWNSDGASVNHTLAVLNTPCAGTNTCSCPNNKVTNPSFESGTTGWGWSGGTLTAGTGAVACGSYSGDFQISNTSSNWVSQTIGTDLAAGTVVNASVYAGTHDNSFYHAVKIDFFDANWVWLSSSVSVEVNKVLSASPVGPQLYSWSATVPSNAKYTQVGFSGNGNWIKTDQWCVTTTPPAATGSIGDRVWLDADGDGIQDATETGGLTGITVQLKNSAGTVIATTTTNSSGNYLFSGLAAGTYKVVFPATISGAVATTQNVGADDNIDSDASQANGETGNIVLAAGQNITNVDAGYCPITLEVGNRVWNDINNDGLNNGEAGIASVTVRLYKDDNNDNVADGAAIATTTTDANGYYLFSNLGPGNYIVGVVTPSGFTSSSINGGDPDNDINLDDNGQVTVGGETRGLAITLVAGTEPDGTNNNTNTNITYDFGFYQPAPTGSIGDRVWYDANGNGIQDVGENTGITGVTVQLKNSAGTVIATTNTDANGNYIFTGLAAGTYKVVFPASINGAVVTTPNVGSDDNIDSDADQTTGETGNIVLGAGQNITNVDAGYCPINLSLGDRIFDDFDNDGYRDDAEPGIGGLTVRLYKDDNNDNIPDGAALATTTTNPTGNYRFDNLGPGNYIVGVVIPAGYRVSSINGGDPDDDIDRDNNGKNIVGTEVRGDAITLTGGGETLESGNYNHTYDFGFYKLASLGDRVFKDDDRDGIQDAGEVGVAGVTVTLLNSAGQVVATTTTDAFGNYKFSNLVPGDYTVRITPPANYSIGPKDQGADDNLDSDFDAVTATTGTVTLISGQNRTDVDCALVFSQPVMATVGDRVWLDNGSGANAGNGTQDAGEPGVANVLVTLYNSAGVAVKSVFTDANGNYLFTDVPAGTYTVGVSLPVGTVFTTNSGVVSSETNSDINPATGRTASFTVNTGDQIRYVDAGIKVQQENNGSVGDFVWNDLDKDGVQDAGEPGIPGVTVRLYNATTNAVIATTTTDALGNYTFNDLASGDYFVEFVTPGGYTRTVRNNVNAAQFNTDSDMNTTTGRTNPFSLNSGQRIPNIDAGFWLTTPPGTGKIGDRVWYDVNQNGIQDAGEQGIAGVTVTLYDNAGNPIKQTITDQNGNYIFTDLAAGTYTVGFSNLPQGFTFTTTGQGTGATDSDADPATGRTGNIVLAAGQTNLDVDAGLRQALAGTASLGNRVWYDLNNNGLQESGEPGVQGVNVELLDNAGNPVDKDPVTPGVQPTTATTNALGEYLFTGLAAGQYRVRFGNLPAGYVVVAKNAGANRDIDSDGNALAAGTSTTDVVSLAINQERLDIDLGIFNSTAPVGKLGDRVWFDVNNNGLQDGGEQGVPGVSVALLNGAGAIIATTTTDANGNYLFVNLPDGVYSVEFSNLPAGFTFSPANAGADGVDSDADPVTGRTGNYTITGGATNLTVDAGIYSTRAALGDYVWEDTNGNGVQEATEKPIAGVTVTLYDVSGNAITSVITDQNGRYFFSNLNPGTYTVGFSTVPQQLTFTTKDAGAATDATDSDVNPATGRTDNIVLAAGQVNLTVDAGLKPFIPAQIGDYVWSDRNADGLQGGTEPGVPGVLVTLYNSANVAIGSAVTDGNGKYLITNVPPGTGYYLVFSNKPGGPASTWTTQNNPANVNQNSKVDGNGRTGTFSVNEGQIILNLDAGLILPSSLPVQLVSFRGQLVGSNGSLQWTTANELNTAHFDVERSLDGASFTTVGTVAARGNSQVNVDYNLLDNLSSVRSNKVYYRLRIVDKNGAVQYSNNVVVLKLAEVNITAVYPNPFTTQVRVDVDSRGRSTAIVRLVDMTGKTVLRQQKQLEQGGNQITITGMDKLTPGAYVLEVINGDNTITQRLIKQ